jgi:hypothetical protein
MKKKIIEAFKEPLKNRERVMNLLIGGVLTFFPVINLIALGYLGTKLKKNIEQDKSCVKWEENIKGLFIKGLFLLGICVSYVIIPVLLMFLGGRFMLSLSGGKILSLFYFRGQVLNIMGTLLLLIALYFLPFAVCLYLEENEIKKGFQVRKILEKIFTVAKEYTVVYIVIISLLAISTVIMFLFMNSLACFLVSGFVFFYDGLVITNMLSKFFPRKSILISLTDVPE